MHSAEVAILASTGGLASKLEAFRSHHQISIKAELAEFSRQGNQIEWQSLLDDIIDTASQLIANDRKEYGN
jgi:hypothetical protein